MKEEFIALFTRENYKFSTKAGARLSSFYFQDNKGNQGRYRREHPDGELLVYQGRSLRLFAAPNKVKQGFNEHQIYTDINDGVKQHAGFSLVPVTGYHVWEFRPPNIPGHGSGGTVLAEDPDFANFDFTNFPANYTGETSEW